jgi:thioredoxin-related protein
MKLKTFSVRAWAGAILTCVLIGTGPVLAAGLAAADDLARIAENARAQGVPILLAFIQERCVYCERAKREHWLPLQAAKKGVVFHEVDVESETPLRDFDGRTVTSADLVRRYRVKRVPTVVVVDPRGRMLSAPLVGLLSEDFYQLYLEQAIEDGLHQIRAARGPR